MIKKIAVGILSVWGVGQSFALTLPLPEDGSRLVGKNYSVFVQPGDSFNKIAAAHDVGLQELIQANPGINPKRMDLWSEVIIPQQFILPDAPQKGIVINLPELRLYYYPAGGDTVMTFPVAVGKQGWRTPEVKTSVVGMKKDPAWRPPKSIKAYMAEKGVILPDVVPAGPNNPLGQYALRLGHPGYLIHGTNKDWTVGNRASSGCIRLRTNDIEALFSQASVGLPVQIVNQPYKVTRHNNDWLLESHRPFYDQMPTPRNELDSLIKRHERTGVDLDDYHMYEIREQSHGYPQLIQSKDDPYL